MRVANQAKLLLGATLLVAGFGTLTGGSPIRGPFARSAIGLFDMQDRQCRHASVAAGSICPPGCLARPDRSPNERVMPPECHSAVWVATCGAACTPGPGLSRLPDGRLADAHRLVVALDGPVSDALSHGLQVLSVSLEPRFDGLDRYDAVFETLPVEKMKERLSALSGIVSVDYAVR